MAIRQWYPLLWSFALSTCLVHAQSPDPLTLRTAVERSLAANPQLRAFEYELAVQEGRIEQARARPALELGITLEDFSGRGQYGGSDAAETTLSVGWVWERGLRAQRVRSAQVGMEALHHEAQVKRLDTAAETARRFLVLLAHQQQLQELQRALHLAEETHAAVQARVAAAKAPEVEVARSYAQLARARLELEHEEHELLAASVRLAAMWGQLATDTDSAPLIVQGDLLSLPPLPAFATLHAQLQRNPQRAQLLTLERLRDVELALASAQRPAWRIHAGVRRFEATADAALVFGVTLPLTQHRQYQGTLAVARAQAEQARAHSASLDMQLQTELFALYQELKHAISEATALREEVLPRMEAALTQARYAYERGRYGYTEWLAIQRELIDTQRALIAAAANAHRQRIEIERLTGADWLAGAP